MPPATFNSPQIQGTFRLVRATVGCSGERVDANRNNIDAVELDPDCDRYPDLAATLAYWRSKCRGRFAPTRADIDPADIVAVLPRVMVAEVSYDPLDFRYRLAGTGIRSIHGEELTNKRAVDLAPPAFGRMIQAHYELAVARRAPLLHLLRLDFDKAERSYVRMILPLSEDGRRVDRLMIVESHEQNTHELREFFDQVRAGETPGR